MFKNHRGQALPEFALTLPLFLMFVFALIALGWWGAASHCAQESAHAASRKYAVTEDEEKAIAEAQKYFDVYQVFIKTSNVSLSKNQQEAKAIVTINPTLNGLFKGYLGFIKIDKIEKTSTTVLEDYIRNPEEYHARK